MQKSKWRKLTMTQNIGDNIIICEEIMTLKQVKRKRKKKKIFPIKSRHRLHSPTG